MYEELLHFGIDLPQPDELLGMTVEALDGQVGKVTELVETERGTFLRVDTGPWIFGREIVLPAGLVTEIDPAAGAVRVQRPKEELKNAPPLAAGESGEPVGEAVVEYFAAAAAADLPAGQQLASSESSAPPGAAEEWTAEADTALTEARGPSPGAQSDLGEPTERPPWPLGPASTDVGPAQIPPTEAAPEEPAAADVVKSSEVEAPVQEEADERTTGEPTTPDAEEAEAASGATAESPPDVEPADAATPPERGTVEASVAPERGDRARAGRSERGRAKSARGRRKKGEHPDLPIAGYETLSAAEVQGKLRGLAQSELTKVERFERRHDNRRTVLQRIEALRGDEPWRGYDRQNVGEITQRLAKADGDRIRFVREYERRHKDRDGVLDAARRRLAAK